MHVMETTVIGLADPLRGSLPRGITMREWLSGAGPSLLAVTMPDLRQHLKTVIPPVRATGHLEIRVIDAQPEPDGWVVPAAVVAALLDNPDGSDRAVEALRQ